MAIQTLGRVRFHGVLDDKNVSAIAFWRGKAVIATDEVTSQGNVVQMFEAAGDEAFKATANGAIHLDPSGTPPAKAKEMDLEGVTVDGDTVFVIGSHSAKRKRVDPLADYDQNREALTGPPKSEPSRDVLLRIKLGADGRATGIDRSSLREFLLGSEPFKSCCSIASKENGPDIEGIANRDGKLYVGFRGPVLRGNFTPILRCRFGTPMKEPTLLFVNLGGRGVRDLAEVNAGMLILAGPVGEGPGSYQMYFWDGRDTVPGKHAPVTATAPALRVLGDLPDLPPGAKAEGLALLAEATAHWDVLIVFDGLTDGHGIRYRITRP